MKLPSGTTTEQLREHFERSIAAGTTHNHVLKHLTDMLALLVAFDLRERLDPDVQRCARAAKAIAKHRRDDYPGDKFLEGLAEAAERVLKHEPKLDMTKASS